MNLPDYGKVVFPDMHPIPFHILFPQMDDLAIEFLLSLLQLNPQRRLTANLAWNHPFLTNVPQLNPNPPALRNHNQKDSSQLTFPSWRRSELVGKIAVKEALFSLLVDK